MQLPGILLSAEKPSSLLILLHGYGGTNACLLPLAQQLTSGNPSLACWIPDGLDPCEQYPEGRQWFSAIDIAWDEPLPLSLKHRVQQAGERILTILSDSGYIGPYFIGGFSQGACLAMHMGLYQFRTKGILAFSGFYPSSYIEENPVQYTPPLFWYHGAKDHVVPIDSMKYGLEAFAQAGVKTEHYVDPNAEHSISSEGALASKNFLEMYL